MDGACSTYGGRRGVNRVWVGKPGGKRTLVRPWRNNNTIANCAACSNNSTVAVLHAVTIVLWLTVLHAVTIVLWLTVLHALTIVL